MVRSNFIKTPSKMAHENYLTETIIKDKPSASHRRNLRTRERVFVRAAQNLNVEEECFRKPTTLYPSLFLDIGEYYFCFIKKHRCQGE